MNYFSELKAFYDLLETNPLPSPAIAVWHALMHIANKTGWQQEFAVAVSVLEMKSGLNAKAVERARNKLAQAGLITWKTRRGNQAAIYTMNSLCDKFIWSFVSQPVPQPVPQCVPQPVPQPVAINRQIQNKTNNDRENRAKFVKPTLLELQEYCAERKNKVDPQRFLDHYESNGWRVGKTTMKDWKASVRTWERNEYEPGTQNPSAKTGVNSSLDMDKISRILHGGTE